MGWWRWWDARSLSVVSSQSSIAGGGVLEGEEAIGAGGHDGVVAMQTVDLFSGPRDAHAAPFCQDGGVVLGAFSETTKAFGEGERFHEVAEAIGALEAVVAVIFDEGPTRELGQEGRDLVRGEAGVVFLAGNAMFGGECGHGVPSSMDAVIAASSVAGFREWLSKGAR